MKVDVKIAGANYTEVPSILLPLTAGGKARFCEVSDTTAEIGDVARGKKFYTADGELVEGTANVSVGVDTRKKITLVQKGPSKKLRLPAIIQSYRCNMIRIEMPCMLQNIKICSILP